LQIDNSTLKGIDADTKNITYIDWIFQIFGNAIINNSEIFHRISIYSDNVTIENSMITGYGSALHISNSSPIINNNIIFGEDITTEVDFILYEGSGINIYKGVSTNPIISNNIITSWDTGIEITDAKCRCSGNQIMNVHYGIDIYVSKDFKIDDTYINNSIYGIKIIWSKNVSIHNVTIKRSWVGLTVYDYTTEIHNSSFHTKPSYFGDPPIDISVGDKAILFIFFTPFNESRIRFDDFGSRIITEDKVYQREPVDTSEPSYFHTIVYGVIIAIIAISISFKLYRHRFNSSD